ncbi:MAG: von Willebrand factor type A domain-containing protein [Gemmatimonas sp.]
MTLTIVGTIRDAATNQPLGTANVFVTGTAITATSADNGRYSISVPKVTRGSTVRVEIKRLGYGAVSAEVVANSDTERVDVALVARPMMLDQVTVAAKMNTEFSTKSTFATSMVSVERSAPQPMLKGRAASNGDETRKRQEVVGFAREKLRADGGGQGTNREQYDRIEDNPFLAVKGNALSTFSIDVDRASYANMRRFLNDGQLPPADAIRIEELINYFPYALEEPRGKDPIAITTEVAPAPWQTKHQLVRIALQARRIETENLPANNLVFLIDVSGSMGSPDKLPLVKQSLRLLVDQLRERDRVALVVYAGNAGLVLPSTSGADKATIQQAIERLDAGGSTAGGAGIKLAYSVARENFIQKGNNRVILATDGDFNVGASSDAEMERLIEEKRSEGTYLTVLGFGRGNIQDAKMEKLAKKGNGNYAYVDNLDEARKTLVREMGATLVTVANDVKLQVEFNPSTVKAYRLIGYEDRLLRNEDFADDRKDAGDIGAGHTVTALYEVVPVGVDGTVKVLEEDGLRYVTNSKRSTPKAGSELMYVKLRYKTPGDSTSKLMTYPVLLARADGRTSDDFRFAASVASFGMLLRNSEYKGNATGYEVLRSAREAMGEDVGLYRAEFVRLVERWRNITVVTADKNER